MRQKFCSPCPLHCCTRLFAVVCLALFLEPKARGAQGLSIPTRPPRFRRIRKISRRRCRASLEWIRFDFLLFSTRRMLLGLPCLWLFCPLIFAKFVNVLLMEFEHLLGAFGFARDLLFVFSLRDIWQAKWS